MSIQNFTPLIGVQVTPVAKDIQGPEQPYTTDDHIAGTAEMGTEHRADTQGKMSRDQNIHPDAPKPPSTPPTELQREIMRLIEEQMSPPVQEAYRSAVAVAQPET
ncbi:MAG: hypothetical protein ACPGVK_02510 [Halocynthiibacter sp.]